MIISVEDSRTGRIIKLDVKDNQLIERIIDIIVKHMGIISSEQRSYTLVLNNQELVFAYSFLGYNMEFLAASNGSVAVTRNFVSSRDFNRLLDANASETWNWSFSFEIYFDIAFLEGSRRSFSISYSGNSAAPFSIP